MGGKGGEGGGKREKRPSSQRLRTLVGGFKVGAERPKSQEIDLGWDEIGHQLTPTALSEALTSLIEDALALARGASVSERRG